MRKKITTLEDLAVIIENGFKMMNGHFDKIERKSKKNKRKISKIKKKIY